jgi:hypothetical protein
VRSEYDGWRTEGGRRETLYVKHGGEGYELFLARGKLLALVKSFQKCEDVVCAAAAAVHIWNRISVAQ